MNKLTLTDIVSGYAIVSAYNTNNTAIETAIENTLSRDGTAPNAMGAILDMGGYKVQNVADGALSTDAVNLRQLQATTGTAAAFPSQTGNANKVLKTDGTVVAWEKPQDITNSNVPSGNLAATTIQGAVNELQSDVDTRALDSAVVHNTGNETVAGNKTFTGTTATQALVDLSHASAGQIKFPAAQNASADANTLDDYEEGTWTPSVGGTATYTGTNTGSYIKIGKLVFVYGTLSINAIGTGSQFVVSGLPAALTTSVGMPVEVASWSTLATAVYDVRGTMSGTTISFYGTTASNATSSTGGTLVLFQNNASIIFSAVYLADN